MGNGVYLGHDIDPTHEAVALAEAAGKSIASAGEALKGAIKAPSNIRDAAKSFRESNGKLQITKNEIEAKKALNELSGKPSEEKREAIHDLLDKQHSDIKDAHAISNPDIVKASEDSIKKQKEQLEHTLYNQDAAAFSQGTIEAMQDNVKSSNPGDFKGMTARNDAISDTFAASPYTSDGEVLKQGKAREEMEGDARRRYTKAMQHDPDTGIARYEAASNVVGDKSSPDYIPGKKADFEEEISKLHQIKKSMGKFKESREASSLAMYSEKDENVQRWTAGSPERKMMYLKERNNYLDNSSDVGTTHFGYSKYVSMSIPERMAATASLMHADPSQLKKPLTSLEASNQARLQGIDDISQASPQDQLDRNGFEAQMAEMKILDRASFDATAEQLQKVASSSNDYIAKDNLDRVVYLSGAGSDISSRNHRTSPMTDKKDAKLTADVAKVWAAQYPDVDVLQDIVQYNRISMKEATGRPAMNPINVSEYFSESSGNRWVSQHAWQGVVAKGAEDMVDNTRLDNSELREAFGDDIPRSEDLFLTPFVNSDGIGTISIYRNRADCASMAKPIGKVKVVGKDNSSNGLLIDYSQSKQTGQKKTTSDSSTEAQPEGKRKQYDSY